MQNDPIHIPDPVYGLNRTTVLGVTFNLAEVCETPIVLAVCVFTVVLTCARLHAIDFVHSNLIADKNARCVSCVMIVLVLMATAVADGSFHFVDASLVAAVIQSPQSDVR